MSRARYPRALASALVRVMIDVHSHYKRVRWHDNALPRPAQPLNFLWRGIREYGERLLLAAVQSSWRLIGAVADVTTTIIET